MWLNLCITRSGASPAGECCHPLLQPGAMFLPTAIDSARRQDYRPLETIVVDDGLTDATSATANRYGVLVIRQSNNGVGSARNTGLGAARGDFVIFLDADDELLPDAVASGVDSLTRHTTASCVVRLCQSMDAEGTPMPTQHPTVETSDLYRAWLLRNFVWDARRGDVPAPQPGRNRRVRSGVGPVWTMPST